MLLNLQTPSPKLLFLFPSKTLNPNKPRSRAHSISTPSLSSTKSPFSINAVSSDEFPVDETFLQNFGPKDKETEDEARRKNWIEREWAPWEEILSPEVDFARKSLDGGAEVALKSPEAIEAFRMLRRNYRKKKMEELGMSDDEFYEKQFEIKGEKPKELRTVWDGPVVVRLVAPQRLAAERVGSG